MDLITSSDPVRWVASAYFSLTTVTTIGYGDIVPYTVADMLVSACLRNLPAARGRLPSGAAGVQWAQPQAPPSRAEVSCAPTPHAHVQSP